MRLLAWMAPSWRSGRRLHLSTITIPSYRRIPYILTRIYKITYGPEARCGQPDRSAAQASRPASVLHGRTVRQHGQGRDAAWHVAARGLGDRRKSRTHARGQAL